MHQEIAEADVTRILRRLGFALTETRVGSNGAPEEGVRLALLQPPDAYTVEIPTWRLDVEREIDVIEEVARVYGFNNFRNTVPSFSGGVIELPHALPESKTRSRLLALGYDEAVSPTFISVEDAQRFSPVEPVALENPLSDEAPLLRNSLVPGMLNLLAWNFNREATDVRLFEMGNVFSMSSERVEQRKLACFAATGSVTGVGSPAENLGAPTFTYYSGTTASGIADAYTLLTEVLNVVPGSEGWPRVREQAKKALVLDPSLADAHASMGAVYFLAKRIPFD